jgi:hypothetical protein
LLELAVIRTVEEYKLLFPNRAITTSLVQQWCMVIGNSKRIRRILSKYLSMEGTRKWAIYK